MEILEFFRILSRYKRMIALMCLSAAVNAVLITYVLSEKYKSTALVLVRPQEEIDINRQSTRTKEAMSFPIPQVIPFEAMAKTFGEVIRSRTVASKVVAQLGLDKPAPEQNRWKRLKEDVKNRLYDAWTVMKFGRLKKVDPFTEAEEMVQNNISVEPTKDSYVFEISFVSKNPDVAAAVVNAAAQVSVDYNRELSQAEAKTAREFIEDQLRESGQALDTARAPLRQFKEANKIVSIDEEVTKKISSLSTFESSLEETRNKIASTVATNQEIRRQLAEQSASLKASSNVSDNPLVRQLKSQLAEKQVELSGVVDKLTPAHPRRVALEHEISQARTMLDAQLALLLKEESSTVNVVHQELLKNLVMGETDLETYRAAERNLSQLVNRYKTELQRYSDKQLDLAGLELNVAVAESTQKFMKQAHDEARIKEAERFQEIRVISPGEAPAYPERPVKVYYALVAFFLALVSGIAAALLLEYLNFTLRSTEDAEKALDLPLLATIPSMDT
jgi:succinoglycan biosynthesis transport protein ExoP